MSKWTCFKSPSKKNRGKEKEREEERGQKGKEREEEIIVTGVSSQVETISHPVCKERDLGKSNEQSMFSLILYCSWTLAVTAHRANSSVVNQYKLGKIAGAPSNPNIVTASYQ